VAGKFLDLFQYLFIHEGICVFCPMEDPVLFLDEGQEGDLNETLGVEEYCGCYGTELRDWANILLPLCTLTPTLFMCSGRIGLAMELYLMYDLESSLRTLPLFPLWYIKVGL
jgi:hypothetical protein